MGNHKLLSQRFVDATNEPKNTFIRMDYSYRSIKDGSKKWVFRILLNGKKPEMGLGNAKVIILSKAREKALQASIQVKLVLTQLVSRGLKSLFQLLKKPL